MNSDGNGQEKDVLPLSVIALRSLGCQYRSLVAIVTTLSGVPRNFVRGRGGVQQIQFRTEDRENGDLWAVAP